MDYKLEVVVIPVSDVDKAKDFYQGLGWRHDADIETARAELAAHGAEVSEVFHDATGIFHHAGTQARITGPAPDHASYGSFVSFADPDANGWLVQEITIRLPGR